MVRIGTAQPRSRLLDYRMTPAEVMAQVDGTLDALEALVQRAGDAGCDVLALPEDTLGLLRWEAGNKTALADVLPAAVERMLGRLGQAAAAHGMYLVCCSDLVETDGALYNTAFFLGRDGKEIGRYHKVNMPLHERNKKCAASFPVFPTPDLGWVGMLICYDMVFPEAARCLALAGADIIFHPTLGGAAFGGAEISRAAFQTRAVENFVYLVVSQRGSGSMILSPQGKVLAECAGTDTIAIADVDVFGGREGGDSMNHQQDMRARLFRERTPEAFGLLTDPNPPVLARIPPTITVEEAVRISTEALTVGETRFQEADSLWKSGKREEAVHAFERLQAEFPNTWIDRVAQERLASLHSGEVQGAETTLDGWQATAPRDEIRPMFSYAPTGGRDGGGRLIITADRREGLDGSWRKPLPVQGGRTYRFHAVRRIENVAVPRRSAVARLLWRDEKGAPTPCDRPAVSSYLKGWGRRNPNIQRTGRRMGTAGRRFLASTGRRSGRRRR